MKIKPKYFEKSGAPLLYYHFLTKISLFIGIFSSFLGAIAYGLSGQFLMCLFFIANLLFCAFSVNLLLRMEWRGVQVLLCGYTVSFILTIGAAIMIEAQGASLARISGQIIAYSIFLLLNWIYFQKRRPLFKPYLLDVNQVSENASTFTALSQEEPKPIVFVYRSNFKLKSPETSKKSNGSFQKHRTIITATALSAAVLIGICGTVYGVIQGNAIQSKEAELNEAEEEIDSLKHEKLMLNREIAEKDQKIQKMQDEIDDNNLMMDDFFTYVDESAFLRSSIGFIVNGSSYYHSYECDVFQRADEYWAHNIEYCEFLGYGPCPICH